MTHLNINPFTHTQCSAVRSFDDITLWGSCGEQRPFFWFSTCSAAVLFHSVTLPLIICSVPHTLPHLHPSVYLLSTHTHTHLKHEPNYSGRHFFSPPSGNEGHLSRGGVKNLSCKNVHDDQKSQTKVYSNCGNCHLLVCGCRQKRLTNTEAQQKSDQVCWSEEKKKCWGSSCELTCNGSQQGRSSFRSLLGIKDYRLCSVNALRENTQVKSDSGRFITHTQSKPGS